MPKKCTKWKWFQTIEGLLGAGYAQVSIFEQLIDFLAASYVLSTVICYHPFQNCFNVSGVQIV